MTLLLFRFDPDLTKDQGPFWLRNVYFVYLLELRAIAKAAPAILATNFEFGNAKEDKETIESVKNFVELVKSFPEHFDESGMFAGGAEMVIKIHEPFSTGAVRLSELQNAKIISE